jgi:hypothetical protein
MAFGARDPGSIPDGDQNVYLNRKKNKFLITIEMVGILSSLRHHRNLFG